MGGRAQAPANGSLGWTNGAIVELKLCADFRRGEKRWRATALQNAGATPRTAEPNTKDESFEEVVKSAQDAAVLVLVY
jgi:hypothetical protein